MIDRDRSGIVPDHMTDPKSNRSLLAVTGVTDCLSFVPSRARAMGPSGESVTIGPYSYLSRSLSDRSDRFSTLLSPIAHRHTRSGNGPQQVDGALPALEMISNQLRK
jgi:hypothetical protein